MLQVGNKTTRSLPDLPLGNQEIKIGATIYVCIGGPKVCLVLNMVAVRMLKHL